MIDELHLESFEYRHEKKTRQSRSVLMKIEKGNDRGGAGGRMLASGLGDVREDYSPNGAAWDYLPHDHARSKAYRWGEDGLAGFCDRYQLLVLGGVRCGTDKTLFSKNVCSDLSLPKPITARTSRNTITTSMQLRRSRI